MHAAFEELESVHLALCLPLAVGQRKDGQYGLQILSEFDGEGLELGHLACARLGRPFFNSGRLPSRAALAHGSGKRRKEPQGGLHHRMQLPEVRQRVMLISCASAVCFSGRTTTSPVACPGAHLRSRPLTGGFPIQAQTGHGRLRSRGASRRDDLLDQLGVPLEYPPQHVSQVPEEMKAVGDLAGVRGRCAQRFPSRGSRQASPLTRPRLAATLRTSGTF
jgi:hypothetical protein